MQKSRKLLIFRKKKTDSKKECKNNGKHQFKVDNFNCINILFLGF
jgi:hypothetical protein